MKKLLNTLLLGAFLVSPALGREKEEDIANLKATQVVVTSSKIDGDCIWFIPDFIPEYHYDLLLSRLRDILEAVPTKPFIEDHPRVSIVINYAASAANQGRFNTSLCLLHSLLVKGRGLSLSALSRLGYLYEMRRQYLVASEFYQDCIHESEKAVDQKGNKITLESFPLQTRNSVTLASTRLQVLKDKGLTPERYIREVNLRFFADCSDSPDFQRISPSNEVRTSGTIVNNSTFLLGDTSGRHIITSNDIYRALVERVISAEKDAIRREKWAARWHKKEEDGQKKKNVDCEKKKN